ncbi:MAG TPA: PASTA domain-containing protein [Gemmatimonadales bacterium]|jgi:serine/threonine-protein kinase
MPDRIKPVGGQTGRRADGQQPAPPEAPPSTHEEIPAAPAPESPRPARRFRLPWAVWLIIGVAATAATGYLVAALVFFPSPMLESERAVASVIGASERDAQNTLQHQGLRDTVIGREPHPTATPGQVIWQDPPAGVAVPRGSMVGVIVSSGTPTVLVPDVKGYDAEIAQLIVVAAGLRVDTSDSVDAKDVPQGAAENTTPPAGERVELRHLVTLHVAR